jgi:hypothetical protein
MKRDFWLVSGGLIPIVGAMLLPPGLIVGALLLLIILGIVLLFILVPGALEIEKKKRRHSCTPMIFGVRNQPFRDQ